MQRLQYIESDIGVNRRTCLYSNLVVRLELDSREWVLIMIDLTEDSAAA